MITIDLDRFTDALAFTMNKTRILIVEDESIVAQDIRQQTVLLGYEPVACTAQGEEAIALVEQLRPDLVLMDIRLAGEMDGIAAATTIRQRFHVPVVFLSALADEAVLQAAKLAEPFGFIVKPFQERELRSTIEMALSKGQADARERRNQAELSRQLREIEQIFAYSPIGLFIIDRENRFLRINERMAEVNGFSVAQHRGKTLDEIVPEFAGFLNKTFRPVFERGEPVLDVEIHGKTPKDRDQERDWIGNYFPLKSETGEVMGLIGAVLEITARKEMERRQAMTIQILSRLTEPGTPLEVITDLIRIIKGATGLEVIGFRFRSGGDFPYWIQDGFSADFVAQENNLRSRAPDGGWRCDQAGRPLLECTCGLVLSGRTDPANAMFTPGGSFWSNDTIPLLDLPADQDPRFHPRNRCIHEGYKSVALIPIRVDQEIVGLIQFNDRRAGRFSLEMIQLFEGLAGNIGSTLARLDAQERLRQSEERYRDLVETSHDLIWRCDAQGCFTFLNRAWESTLGYTLDEMLGQPFTHFQPPEAVARDREEFARHLAGGSVIGYETVHIAKSGARVVLLFNAIPARDSEMRVVGAQGTASDITERKRAEQALHEAHERLRHLSRMLIETREAERRSLARDLHDGLGQTLTAAKIRLQSLVRFPEAQSQVKGIEEGVDALDQVIGQVRQIALALHPPLIEDLGLSAALRWLANQQTAGGLPLELAVPGNLPRFSTETEITTFRIAQEALTNATRHAQASHARLTVCLHQDTLELTVWDDGIGFDVAAARQRAAQGGSLGILGMEERTQLIQGRLEIESQPGQGTELRAWLPLTPPPRI